MYQPLIFAAAIACVGVLDDPLMPWPFYIILNVFGLYICAGWLAFPIWILAYGLVIENLFIKKKIINRFFQWLVLSCANTLPAFIPFIPYVLMEKPNFSEMIPMLISIFVAGCISAATYLIFASVLSLHDGNKTEAAQSLPTKPKTIRILFRGGLYLFLILAVILGVCVAMSYHNLNMPDQYADIKAFKKFIPIEFKSPIKNVYYFYKQGYFLAGGDPVLHYFRFDADKETIRNIISKMEFKSFKEYEKEYHLRRYDRREPKWWNDGKRVKDIAGDEFLEGEPFKKENAMMWIDWDNNRVYFSTSRER